MPALNQSTTIVLVGHGLEPIPPTGWGAVEHVVWEYARRLRARGYAVEIVNEKPRRAIKSIWNLTKVHPNPIIHCHSEKPIRALNILRRIRPFTLVSTLHVPIALPPTTKTERKALRRVLPAPHHLVLIPAVRDTICSQNPQAKAVVFKNAVETDLYSWSNQNNGRACFVGRIQARKRQNEVALALADTGITCDFIGPDYGEVIASPELTANMVGEWDKATLYSRLHEYGCLVLFSTSEGQPLVVMEALASGLPVVVSPAAAEGLDRSLPFVHLVSDPQDLPRAIKAAIDQKTTFAEKIRKYAEQEFDYDRRIDQYLEQLHEWHSS